MEFNEILKEINVCLTDTQLKQFEIYFEFLVEYNEKVNLTAITKKEEVYIKHFYDCLTLSTAFDFTKVNTICDVGAGAGFPSIPLKILYPHLHVTIVDALNKRIKFLDQLAVKLDLTNYSMVHSRAEEFARTEKRESFDVVLARAVARLNVLNELCIPLVKVNGHFISMKSKEVEVELSEGNSLQLLNGKLLKVVDLMLPNDSGERKIVIINHFKKTPGIYPRDFNKIKSNPL